MLSKEKIIELAKKLNMELDEKTIKDIEDKHVFFMEELDKMKVYDTTGVKPMHRIDETETSFMREDVAGEVLPVEAIIKNASETEGNFVSIQKVVK